MEKVLIVAIADNNAIGRNNELLWHISEDLKFFKRTTMGCPVVMGRKTFESIGRPLPKRLNIVVSRSGFVAPEGVLAAGSLQEAFDLASPVMPCPSSPSTVMPCPSSAVMSSPSSPVMSSEVETSAARVFVIGGGQIYAQAMPLVDRLIVTHVHTVIEDADTFFPRIDPDTWKVASRSEMMTDPETGYTFEFVEYIRN